MLIKNYFIFILIINQIKQMILIPAEQVSLCFFWSKTNTQIRIQANIKKISNEESDLYFSNKI